MYNTLLLTKYSTFNTELVVDDQQQETVQETRQHVGEMPPHIILSEVQVTPGYHIDALPLPSSTCPGGDMMSCIGQ